MGHTIIAAASVAKRRKSWANQQDFLEYERETAKVLPPKVRIANFKEFRTPLNKEKQKLQGARCMACGVPFCQSGMMIGGMASGLPSAQPCT